MDGRDRLQLGFLRRDQGAKVADGFGVGVDFLGAERTDDEVLLDLGELVEPGGGLLAQEVLEDIVGGLDFGTFFAGQDRVAEGIAVFHVPVIGRCRSARFLGGARPRRLNSVAHRKPRQA